MKIDVEKMNNIINYTITTLFAMVLLLIVVFSVNYSIFISKNVAQRLKEEEQEKARINEILEKESKNSKVDILAVGDVMVHSPQLVAQKTQEGYDFSNNFKYVKDIISNADIAIANLETTLAGPTYPYDGYPRFNTPDVLVDTLKDTGFNVINFCNNHILDMGKEALLRTIDVLDQKGLPYIGVRKSEEGKRYIVLEKNNMKVAICGYTYQIPSANRPTLNGNVIPGDMINLINTFGYHTLDNDLNEMGKVVEDMKKESDITVVVIHWGNEYETKHNSYQEKIATYLSQKGVDVIFGSHPHVLQPFDTIDDTLVFYSMGNFLSNQRYEAMNRRDTEDGIILKTTFERKYNKETDVYDINYLKTSYISTWVDKYYDKTIGKYVYEILPLNKEEANVKTSELVEVFNSIDRANISYNTTENIIKNSNIKNIEEIKINITK